MVLKAGLEPASRRATDFKSVVYTIPPLQQIVLQGFEPWQREPKSLVLPLHHKTERRGIRFERMEPVSNFPALNLTIDALSLSANLGKIDPLGIEPRLSD